MPLLPNRCFCGPLTCNGSINFQYNYTVIDHTGAFVTGGDLIISPAYTDTAVTLRLKAEVELIILTGDPTLLFSFL